MTSERQPGKEDYSASLDIYTYMAHFVAKELNIRPNEILDNWCVPELIVAFGQYGNEKSMQNYEQWKTLSSDYKNKVVMPNQYAVYFEKI